MAKYPMAYLDDARRRRLDLRRDGVACVPLLGFSNFPSVHAETELHVHPGCVEICVCLRGELAFETPDAEYSFLPGSVFVSQPSEPHRMRHNPKGLMLYWLLFQIPPDGESVLDLPSAEGRWLVERLTNFPVRLFLATDRVKAAFERLFKEYDGDKRRTDARRLKMKTATQELLLSLVEAADVPQPAAARQHAKVNAIVARMRSQPSEDYPLEELVRESALSAVAFNDAFKCATGLPPHAFLLDARVKAAANDLKNTSLSVAAVARKYRFSSPQYFATVFKRITGVPPRRRSCGFLL